MTSTVAVELNVLVLAPGGILSVGVTLTGKANLWPDAVAAAVAAAWRLPGLAPDVIAVEPTLYYPISPALAALHSGFETPEINVDGPPFQVLRAAAGAWRN